VHISTGLRPGLAFMTFHFPEQVETNIIVNDAYDPKSGTSEFKATAIRVERLSASAGVGA
jgi:formate dehydrogenase major subunit